MNTKNLKQTAYIGLFAAISTLLMYIEFPLPFMPPFLKVDLSGVPIFIAGFMFGPVPALIITLVKDLIHLLSTQTGGVGELADFVVTGGSAFVAALIYKFNKNKKTAVISCFSGVITMAVIGGFANKFILIPFYKKVMPVEAIIGACQKVNPAINSIDAYIYFGAVPFNMIKGIIIAVLTLVLYKRLSKIIKSSLS